MLYVELYFFLLIIQAAIKGEEWKPTGLDIDKSVNKKRAKSLHPPKKPPPRAAQENASREVTHDNITMEITDESEAPARSAADKKPTRPPPRPRMAKREGIQTPSDS